MISQSWGNLGLFIVGMLLSMSVPISCPFYGCPSAGNRSHCPDWKTDPLSFKISRPNLASRTEFHSLRRLRILPMVLASTTLVTRKRSLTFNPERDVRPATTSSLISS
ncbi:hypothetical protein BGZ57DRAFT_916663 [Hyaloscypha finlandica]|nr:hypothetical protein BGZ57DRAFT_916663 [Hyaloscypha finlandica]